MYLSQNYLVMIALWLIKSCLTPKSDVDMKGKINYPMARADIWVVNELFDEPSKQDQF